MLRDVRAVELAGSLRRAAAAQRDQPAQPPPGGAVLRIGDQRGAVHQVEPRPDEQPQPGLLRRDMGAHHAGHRVAVGDADRGQAEEGRLPHQLGGMGRALEEAIVGDAVQLGIGGGRHGNAPH